MTDKNISEHGLKTKTGLLLSKYLRQIGEEETETVTNQDGETVLATKIEALARKIWQAALGGFAECKNDDGTVTKVFIPPDRVAWHLIFDRTEGKVVTIGEGGKPGGKISDKVSEQGKSRIEKAARGVGGR